MTLGHNPCFQKLVRSHGETRNESDVELEARHLHVQVVATVTVIREHGTGLSTSPAPALQGKVCAHPHQCKSTDHCSYCRDRPARALRVVGKGEEFDDGVRLSARSSNEGLQGSGSLGPPSELVYARRWKIADLNGLIAIASKTQNQSQDWRMLWLKIVAPRKRPSEVRCIAIPGLD